MTEAAAQLRVGGIGMIGAGLRVKSFRSPSTINAGLHGWSTYSSCENYQVTMKQDEKSRELPDPKL